MRIICKQEHVNASLAPFLGISYEDPEAFLKAQNQLSGRSYPRESLAEILKKYNASIGNDAMAQDQIDRLKQSDSVCVVTGQQLGLMGGPAYTILKAMTCLLVAKETNAIPIFWLATEDHDLSEINHTYLLDVFGNLEKFSLNFPKDGRCVEDLEFNPKHVEVIERFMKTVNLPKNPWIKPGQSYAMAMARLMASQFAGTGLVFVEPRLLRPLAIPFLLKELEESEKILDILRQTTKRLEMAGGHAVLPLREGTNLFMKDDHLHRQKIRFDGVNFTTGTKNYSKQELLRLIKYEPERFSSNVAARPVLQSKLFPTLAYVAGPSELVYFQQLGDYHRFHDVPMPCIVPRLSATLIPRRAEVFLTQCRLDPSQPLPQHWIELMPEISESIHSLTAEWNQSAQKYFQKDVSPEVLLRYVRWALRKVQRKVCKSKLRSQGVPTYALHFLHNLIHPHGKLQERVLNWHGFQAQTKDNLVTSFLKEARWKKEGHFYCYLS